MSIIASIGFFFFGALLTAVASIVPRSSVLSQFELLRRRDHGNQSAAEELRREILRDDVMSLRHACEALLLVLVTLMSVAAFGLVLGIFVALLVALTYGRIARIEFIHTWTMGLYERYEMYVLRFVERIPRTLKLLRSVSQSIPETEISSREELEHLVENSGQILTNDEKKLIVNGLGFDSRRVEEIMTPRGVIDTIPASELIGPLALDDLHKTGHSRFPVIDGDIDHVVGTLQIKELLTLDDKRTKTARQAMEKRVFYINQDQTLNHALAAFLKTRHHLFIVVNGYRETAGIVTLEDVIEALLGRKIVDEFDVHDDLRIVAARAAKENNNPPNATDV